MRRQVAVVGVVAALLAAPLALCSATADIGALWRLEHHRDPVRVHMDRERALRFAGLGRFVAKLKVRSELRLGVRRFPDTAVTDRISLSGRYGCRPVHLVGVAANWHSAGTEAERSGRDRVKVKNTSEANGVARFETECGTVFVRSESDIRLRVDGRLVRDRAGNFLFAETVADTRSLIESLVVQDGLYVRTV